MFCDNDTISGVSVSGELSEDDVQNVKSPVGVYILLGCCMPFVVLITCWGVIIVCWGVGEVLNAVVGNSFFFGERLRLLVVLCRYPGSSPGCMQPHPIRRMGL